MANKFWNTIKNTAQNLFGGKSTNTSTGSSGTGSSVPAQTPSAPVSQPTANASTAATQKPTNNIVSYNSGIAGTPEYAKRNNDAFQAQYQLAKKAGVSDNQFYSDYRNGVRWLDKANESSVGIRQYDSGILGTREYAKAHNDEFQSQYKLAINAGLSDDDFYREYSRGQRWTSDIENQPSNLDVANGAAPIGTGKTLAEDEDYSRDLRAKIHTGLFDNDAVESRRLKRLQEKYGKEIFGDDFSGQFKANFGMARIQEEYFQAVSDYLDNPTEGNRQYKDDLKALLSDFQMRNAEALDDQNVQAGWLSKNLASYFPQLWNQTKATIIPGAAGLAFDVFTGTGAATGMAGTKLGTTVGSGIYSYNSMRGAAFENLVDVGVDENTARQAANDEAVVSSIIEMGDTAVDLFTMIPGLGSAAKEAAKDVAVKSLSKKLLGELGKYGFNIAEEYGEEFVQELLSMANQRRCEKGEADSGIKGLLSEAVKLAGEMLGGEAKDEFAQANEAGKGGAIIGAFMGGVHLTTGNISTAVSNNQIRNQLSRLDEQGAAGYNDEYLQKMLNAAVNPDTRNEQAAQILRSEIDRRAMFDNDFEDVDTGGVLKTVDQQASEKAKERVAKENKAVLDELTRDDVTPDKVNEEQLCKLFREAQRLGSTKGRFVIANELNARTAAERNEQAVIPNAEAQEWTGEIPEGAANVIAQQQQQEQVPTTEAPINPTVEEQAAPAEPEPMQVAGAAAAAAEEEPTVVPQTGNVIVDQQAQRSEQLTLEQRKAMYKAMSREELLELLAHAKAVGDVTTEQLVKNELQNRAFPVGRKKEQKQATRPVHAPKTGEGWQANATNVQFDETGKPTSQKERPKSKAREIREAFGDTSKDVKRENENGYHGPVDDTAYSPLTGEPIPVSLDDADVEAFALQWGLSEKEKTELVERLQGFVEEYGKDEVFGLGEGDIWSGIYKPEYRMDENRQKIPLNSEEDKLTEREESIYRNMLPKSSLARVQGSDVTSNAENTQPAITIESLGTPQNVDGRDVYTYSNENGSYEGTALLKDKDGNTLNYIFLKRGGKVLGDKSVHPRFGLFKDFFSRFFIKDIIPTDSPFSVYDYNETDGLHNASTAKWGVRSSRKSGLSAFLAADINKRGTLPHEITHQIQELAEATDKVGARDIIDKMISDIIPQQMYDDAREAILNSGYGKTVLQEFFAAIDNLKEQNPSWWAALSDYEKAAKEAELLYGWQEGLIRSELFSNISGGCDCYGVAVYQYTKAFVGDKRFRDLLILAGQSSGASNTDIEILDAWYNLIADRANGGEGATVKEAVSSFYDIVKQYQKGEESENAKGFSEQERTSANSGRNNGAIRTGNSDERSPGSLQGANSGRSSGISGRSSEESEQGESAGIISRFEQSPEAQEPVGSRRITHGKNAEQAPVGEEPGRRIAPEDNWMDEAPRDVTAEEREVTAQQTYAEDEQRAEDARQNSRRRARVEHGRNAAGIFAASKNIATQKMADESADEAFQKIRTAAEQVADGKLTPGDFAEFYANMQADSKLAQFTLKHVADAMQDMRRKYLALLDNINPHNQQAYSQAAEKAMTMAEHSFRQINENFAVQRRLAELIKENGKGKDRSKGIAHLAKSVGNFYTRMQISPENMFRGMIGGWDTQNNTEANKMSKDITAANITHQHIIAGSQMAFAELRKVKGMEQFIKGKDKTKVTTQHGFSANLSQVELAHLYMSIKTLMAEQRRFGDRLDTLNGFAFGDQSNPDFYDIQKDIKASGVSAAQYLIEVQNAVYAKLSDVAKQYIDVASGVLEDLGKKNYETEMKVNGVAPGLYKRGEYVHLRYANPNETLTPTQLQAENIDFGAMHERTRRGGGYVRIAPLTAEIDRYISQSANHIAYSELARRFELLNRDTEQGGKNIVSLMEENYGKQFAEWMKNFIDDVSDFNPQERTDGVSSLLRAGRQAVQTGALIGSVSVPIKQVSSYWAASGKLRMSSLVKAYRPKIIPARKGKFNSNKQNSLLLYNRRVGGIDPTLSEVMNSSGPWNALKQHSKLLQTIEKAIPMEDYLTVSNVYDACVIEMKEDHPRMDFNSKEFAELVENKFEEVVMETQPIFTKNARPEYARTDSEFIKMFSMFRTQQTQNFNRMMRSIGEYKKAKGTAHEFLAYSQMAETFKGQAASAMSLAILSVVADFVLHKLKKFRDDDDEIAPEKVIERIGLNAAAAAAGTAWFGDSALKWAIDKINAARGKDSNEFYGVNMGIVSTVKNVVESVGWFLETPTLSNARYVAGYIAQTFGLPLNNAYQILNFATMYARDIAGKNENHYDDILKMIDKEMIATRKDSDKDKARVLINNYLKGNEDKALSIVQMIDADKQNSSISADVKRRYMAGQITSEEAQDIMAQFTDLKESEIERRNDLWDFIKENPKYADVTESFVQNYNNYGAPADIPVNQFFEYMKKGGETHSIDVDGDGETNGPDDITRKHQLSEYIGSLDISDEQKAALWQSYGYKIDERWNFILENPSMEDVSKSFVEHYDEFAKPAGISANAFYDYMQTFNSTKGIDTDGDGKSTGKNDISKQSQIIEYIDGLNLSKEQKDALWQAFGYKTTTNAFKNRPWK